MNANAMVKHEPKAALVVGADVQAIIPRSVEEIFRLAGAISASGLAPSTLNSPEKVTVAILAGAELGMPPFQSIQSFAVINNRPAIWGDGMLAVVRTNGFKVREWLEGEGDNIVAYCEVTRPDNGEVIARNFSVADAKVANLWKKTGPWTTNPKRMLQMRARAFACRDGAADVLRGFQMREEVEDYTPSRNSSAPQASGVLGRLGGGDADAEGFSAARAAEAAEEIEAEVEDIDTTLHGDDLPAGLKTGTELLAEREAAGATSEPDAATDTHQAEPPAGGAEARQETTSDDQGRPGPETPADGPSEPFDAIAWAGTMLRTLPDYAGVDVFRADWDEHKAELKAQSPSLFKQLNEAVVARAGEIEADG